MSKTVPNTLARSLRSFFTHYLPNVRGASQHTISSYRYALLLLLRFLSVQCGRSVVDLDFCDIDAQSVIAFLNHLEKERDNSTTTRNARLAAIHAFARFVAMHHPEHIETCQRIIAVPLKRPRIPTVEYLENREIQALLEAPNRSAPDGRRDYTLLLTFLNTGARVQELLDLRPIDVQFERPHQVLLRGKRRKERYCPLWNRTIDALLQLVVETGLDEGSSKRIFRNRRGQPLTRFGVRYILRKYATQAQKAAPTLKRKRVHPHTIRHTAAVHLLQAGVDLVSISHWLGHASIDMTNRYTAVDLEAKRKALDKATPVFEESSDLATWRSDESIVHWLEGI